MISLWKNCFNNGLSRFTNGYSRLHHLSYIHHVGKEPLQAITIGNLVQNSATKYGDKTAIISSDKLAAGFLKLGLKSGDRVGLWAPNIIEWIISFAASARVGLTTVALNPAYQEDELKYSINKVGIKALICPDAYNNIKFYEILCNVAPELLKSHLDHISCAKVPSLKSVITVSNAELRGTYNYSEVLDFADDASVTQIKRLQNFVQSDAMANIQYSSGTTGKPKAACLSHFQLVNNSYETGKRVELNKGHHNICVQVPFFSRIRYCVCNIAFALFWKHYGTTVADV
ncbi:hypothetical protein FQR65_LT18736 [Abscondita terminalis]|nr:hypothetical protein FQR65_LT18736 [Abscondita terminalis]